MFATPAAPCSWAVGVKVRVCSTALRLASLPVSVRVPWLLTPSPVTPALSPMFIVPPVAVSTTVRLAPKSSLSLTWMYWPAFTTATLVVSSVTVSATGMTFSGGSLVDETYRSTVPATTL